MTALTIVCPFFIDRYTGPGREWTLPLKVERVKRLGPGKTHIRREIIKRRRTESPLNTDPIIIRLDVHGIGPIADDQGVFLAAGIRAIGINAVSGRYSHRSRVLLAFRGGPCFRSASGPYITVTGRAAKSSNAANRDLRVWKGQAWLLFSYIAPENVYRR
jgi:hypothetical protein